MPPTKRQQEAYTSGTEHAPAAQAGFSTSVIKTLSKSTRAAIYPRSSATAYRCVRACVSRVRVRVCVCISVCVCVCVCKCVYLWFTCLFHWQRCTAVVRRRRFFVVVFLDFVVAGVAVVVVVVALLARETRRRMFDIVDLVGAEEGQSERDKDNPAAAGCSVRRAGAPFPPPPPPPNRTTPHFTSP